MASDEDADASRQYFSTDEPEIIQLMRFGASKDAPGPRPVTVASVRKVLAIYDAQRAEIERLREALSRIAQSAGSNPALRTMARDALAEKISG